MKFLKFLLTEDLELNPINAKKSQFGHSYFSLLGLSHFFTVKDSGKKVGEIEYTKKGNTMEIVSLRIEPEFRGLGYGKESVKTLFDRFNLKEIILMAAPSSRKFWNLLGAKPITNRPNYYIIKRRDLIA